MKEATIYNEREISRLKEFGLFVVKNAWACLYGALFLLVVLISQYVPLPIARYDFIFILAVLIQIILVATKLESFKEVRVILLFHVVATVMELFKTSGQIGSWSYPGVDQAFFKILTVPLFTGFLYSSVGSYISRIIRIFDMHFEQYPKQIYVGLLALTIYINFFTHHYVYDLRYILFAIILLMFWKTQIQFTVHKKVRKFNFIFAGFACAFFVWVAENIASYSNVWLYPDQIEYWKMVSLHKIGSWFLLLIVSFLLVSLVYKDRFKSLK